MSVNIQLNQLQKEESKGGNINSTQDRCQGKILYWTKDFTFY